MTDEYVELHARSAFSFLEGSSLPEDLIDRASELEMPALALVDKNGYYGLPRFHKAGKKKGIRAHVGAELILDSGARLPLLVKNRTGYRNLSRLITAMKMRSEKGAGSVSLLELAEYAEGLVCLTGGIDGPLGCNETPRQIDSQIPLLIEVFGKENLYIELQRHFDRLEETHNQEAIRLARRYRLPLLATNGVSYSKRERRQILDVFACIRHKTTIEKAGRLLAKNSERHLKSRKEMNALFADLPEAIANTRDLSSRLEFSLADLGYRFPAYPVPAGETMDSFLRKMTFAGARRRYTGVGGIPTLAHASTQLNYELAMIEKLGLAGYFLIVWDIVVYCRNEKILTQGRGSAANSAVCYALGITAVDPVRMELLFERFLSEERGEWPDIDLDLPSGDQREKVIQHVYQKYGHHGAAMTANVITYRGRSAVRDIGKVLGFDEEVLGRLSKFVRPWEWKDPNDREELKFRDSGLDLADARIAKFFELSQAIQDLPRHLGQHSGGMVICEGALDAVVPLEPASMPGRVVVQWDKDDCADLGIIKVDLLGLGMMAALEETLETIKNTRGEIVDLGALPQDDPKVYDSLQRADTIGLFQVESRAQMSCLPRIKPEKFYDLVVQVAIIRPGPVVGNMVHPYIRRRQEKENPDCLHPALETVLKRTLGVPLFQEQLLRMAMICAGFTGGEAEELRRAFGFKRSEALMSDVEVKLRHGMNKNGIAGEAQDKIVKAITSFALYGFPESHAASFALLAYASAYLKCYYPAAFTAALLNNQPMGFYQPLTLVKDAQRHGLRLRPIDVKYSRALCTVETDGKGEFLRIGLNYARGLRKEIGERIEQERSKSPFLSIEEFQRRIPGIHKDELRQLAFIGALDSICRDTGKRAAHRRDALWQVERVLRPGGQLFDGIDERQAPSPLKKMQYAESLDADLIGTGMTLGAHPMALYRTALSKAGVLRASEVARRRNGERVRVAGAVIVRQRPGTAKGFLFLSLEDETGIANIIVTPDTYDQNRVLLIERPLLMIEGIMQNQEGAVSIKAQRISGLPGKQPHVQSHDFH